MYKAKLYGFAIVGMLGFIGISPITAFAAETNTESVTQSELNQNEKENKAAFDEKIKKASEKWKTLTAKQKDEVYALMENELQTQINLLDKLVEFGVMEKEDAVILKVRIQENFNKVKQSGEFPLLRQKGNKRSK